MKVAYKSYTDEEAIATIKNGASVDAERILKSIYQKNFGIVEQHIRKNSGTSDDAKDVFQEAMMVFYRNVKELYSRVKEL